MPHQAIITGTAGPGRAMVATPIQNITDMSINFNDKRLQFQFDNAPNFASEVELTPTSTITITNSGGNFTVTVA